MRSDRNSAGPPAASIAHRPKARRTGEADHCPVSERGANGESLGQSGGASLSNCRELRAEGESTRSLGCNLSNNTASCQSGIVSQGTNANEASRRSRARRGVSVPDSSTRRVAGHVRSAHIEYAVRARFLPLQELGVQVVEFDLEFLACSISEFGEGCTIEAACVPAFIEDLFEAPEAV